MSHCLAHMGAGILEDNHTMSHERSMIFFDKAKQIFILKGPSHIGKSCYIRGGCVPMNEFDTTDYELALRFFFNCLVLEKSSFEIFE